MRGEYRQVVKLAQPGELKAYVVFEHQLDLLAQGAPTALLLNFALFFLGVAATSLGTLVTAPPNQDRIYYSFLIKNKSTASGGETPKGSAVPGVWLRRLLRQAGDFRSAPVNIWDARSS